MYNVFIIGFEKIELPVIFAAIFNKLLKRDEFVLLSNIKIPSIIVRFLFPFLIGEGEGDE